MRAPRRGAIPRHQDAFAVLVLYTSLHVLADAPWIRGTFDAAPQQARDGLLFSAWDLADPKRADPGICVKNGAAKLLNVDGPGEYAKAQIDTARDCAPAQRLKPVVLPAAMTKDGGKA